MGAMSGRLQLYHTAAGKMLMHEFADRLRRNPETFTTPAVVPTEIGRTPQSVTTTQAALGRTLLDLTREAP